MYSQQINELRECPTAFSNTYCIFEEIKLFIL